jgi:hypothetical protein
MSSGRWVARGAELAAVLLLLHLPSTFAQSLGDAAARERARREKPKPAPAKVYTNESLPASTEGSAGNTEPAAEAAATDAKADAASADARTGELEREREKRKDFELKWRARFAAAREAVARADERAWREVVRTEFPNGIPVQMRIKEHVETEELKQARQALADLEEEFRRTGLPPGWARR